MNNCLTFLASTAITLFFTACTDYSSSYYDGGYGSSEYSIAHVGIIRTSNTYWGYDPYRRSYYDYRARRYYDPFKRTYCSYVPKRYSTPVYPRGYRSGHSLSCPTYLRDVRYRHSINRGNTHSNHRTTDRRRETKVVSTPPRVQRTQNSRYDQAIRNSSSQRTTTSNRHVKIQPVSTSPITSVQRSIRHTRTAPTVTRPIPQTTRPAPRPAPRTQQPTRRSAPQRVSPPPARPTNNSGWNSKPTRSNRR